MTRKDYELIAKIAQQHNQDLVTGKAASGLEGFKGFCSALAIEMAHDSWCFDENKFMTLCGFNS